ncbi:MAG: transglutaminase domain-containing protein [Planctomycetota bacterium]
MPDDTPADKDPQAQEPERENRRVWLFVAAVAAGLLVVLVALLLVNRRSGRQKERAAEACLKALYAMNFPRAVEMFEEFRELTAADIPAEVRDEYMRLSADRYNKNYPLPPAKPDRHFLHYFLHRALLTCRYAQGAFRGAEDRPAMAKAALDYVRTNVQADPTPIEKQPVHMNPIDVLNRGYGNAVQMSWAMAYLLRNAGLHAAVGFLHPTDDDPRYALVGVLIDRRLYLFDPFRGVALCRAADGRVADLRSLLSGEHELAPRFGGPGSPVRVERLRKAAYFVPADTGNVTPDAWLLNQILRGGGAHHVLYRPFRGDLRQLGAAVFGEGTRVRSPSRNHWLLAAGDLKRRVGLWPFPFMVDQAKTKPGYGERFIRAYPGAAVYWDVRSDQLMCNEKLSPAVRQQYGQLLEEHKDHPRFAEDLTFFRGRLAHTPAEQAGLMAGYLAEYPDGRWQPLAAMLQAELEARLGHGNVVRELTRGIEPPSPYALRARLLEQAISEKESGRAIINWRFPEPEPKEEEPAEQPEPAGE